MTAISLELVYREYRSLFVRLAVTRGCQRWEAEDVAHDIVLQVHGALPAYDPERPLRPWLLTIAVRTIRDYLDRERRRRPLQIDVASVVDASGSVGGRLDARVALRELRPHIEALPARERRALGLRAFEQLTSGEMAHELRSSLWAAEALLARARARLRMAL